MEGKITGCPENIKVFAAVVHFTSDSYVSLAQKFENHILFELIEFIDRLNDLFAFGRRVFLDNLFYMQIEEAKQPVYPVPPDLRLLPKEKFFKQFEHYTFT